MSFATSWIDARRLQGIELSLLRKMMAEAPPDAINLALGELSFDFPDLLREQAARLLAKAQPAYTPNAGLALLREAVYRYLNLDKPQQVCICNGAEEALYIALQGIVNPGDIVAIPDPDYPAYPVLAQLAGAELIRLPFADDFRSIDWAEWETKLMHSKALLLSNPSNPSGYRFSERDFARLAKILNQNHIILIIDEIYQDLFFDEALIPHYHLVERIIRIGGVSKSHLMSGWRIGWLIADEKEITELVKLKQYISTCAPWLSQALAAYALQCPEIVQDVRAQLTHNRALCLSTLAASVLHAPVAGPYLMLKCADGSARAAELIRKGVITVPGIAFGLKGREWIRLNIGVPQPTLQQALRSFL